MKIEEVSFSEWIEALIESWFINPHEENENE
jgi:hypothetical protein